MRLGGPAEIDPKRSISFLKTGQSAKSRFCELKCSDAAIGDYTLPANCGRSLMPKSSDLNDCLASSAALR
jgi:hypothetical protein